VPILQGLRRRRWWLQLVKVKLFVRTSWDRNMQVGTVEPGWFCGRDLYLIVRVAWKHCGGD
jgi:hypothetical protein